MEKTTVAPQTQDQSTMGEIPAVPPPLEASTPTATPADTGATSDALHNEVAKHSAVMAIGSLASRATGFIRTAIIGAALSAGLVGNSYQVANTLPNMAYELLLGGVLASVVVPLIVKARKRDADGGEAYVHRLLTLATLVLAAATLLALLAVPLLVRVIIGPDTADSERQLVTWLSYLLLPEIFFYGVVAILGAILNTRGHFAAPMWAPIVNNVVVIGTAIVFMLLPGPVSLNPSTITPTQVLVLGIGTTLGVCAQAIALFPALRRVRFRWRWRFDFAEARLGEMSRLAGWMLCYVAVSQVAVFVVLALTYRAGDTSTPGTFVFNNAFLLFMMVHGVIAVSIITALLPRMSASAVENKFDQLGSQLSLGIRLSSVGLVPATAFLMILGVPVAVLAFQWGQFTSEQAHATGIATVVAVTGLVPFAVSQLQLFAFYALHDTKTPALLNIPVVFVRVALCVLAYVALPAEYVVAGIMVAHTVSYVLAVILSGWLLHRRIGSVGGNQIAQTICRLSLAAFVAGIIGFVLSYGITAWLGDGKVGSLVSLLVAGSVFVGAFVAGAVYVRVKEIDTVWAMIRSKVPVLR